MSGRGFIALGSGLLGVGLIVGVLVGRERPAPQAPASAPEPAPAAERSAPSSHPSTHFAGRQLTATTPAAAPWPAEVPPLQVQAPNVGKVTARPRPLTPVAGDGGLLDASVLDAAPPLPEAGVAPFDAGIPLPDASPPPQPEPMTGAPPPPDPNLVRQGRSFKDANITSSSFDDEDVSEYSVVPDRVVVPDREVTRSSWDDRARENEHPTGP